MNIAKKIHLSFLGPIIFIAALTTTVFFFYAQKELEKQIDTHLETIVVSKTQNVRTYLFMAKIAAGQFSRDITLSDFLKARMERKSNIKPLFDLAMKRLLRTKEANPAILEFLVTDREGQIIASSNEKSLGEDKSSDPFFVEGQKRLYVKDAYYSPVYQKPIIAVSAPIMNEETKEWMGVLAARINLEEIYQILADKTGLGNTGEVYIVNKEGYMISPSRFLENTFLSKKINTLDFKDAWAHQEQRKTQEEKEEILTALDYRGVLTLGANDFIVEMGWSVLAEIDLEEAHEVLEKTKIFFVTIFSLMIFVLWLIGKTISEIITRPIHRLHYGTEIIGDGHLDYKVGTKAKDEIGQLSRAFDQMTQNLKQTTTSIEKLNREIVERKKLEEALKIVDEKKSAFVRDVSHEFRNPLTTARTTLSMILKGDAGSLNEKQKTLLELAKNSIDRLIRLVIDILDLSKIEAGKMEIKREKIEVIPFIEEVLRTYEIDIHKKKQELKKDVPADIGLLWADRDKITGALINLLGNAIKYTPEEGQIGIRVAGDPKSIRFEVWDTGPGLSSEDLGRLFNKFERITAERKDGTGLGLVITKEIIEFHQGKIWVESEVGRGTKFSFVLPRDSRPDASVS